LPQIRFNFSDGQKKAGQNPPQLPTKKPRHAVTAKHQTNKVAPNFNFSKSFSAPFWSFFQRRRRAADTDCAGAVATVYFSGRAARRGQIQHPKLTGY
jgi:hypothetical protein